MSAKKIIDRVKALLAKTVENGATEAEALSAAIKAQEILAKHHLDLSDLEAEEIRVLKAPKRPLSTAAIIGAAVGKFCQCVPFRAGDEYFFAGRESDALFATWLLDALDGFINRGAIAHLASLPVGVADSNRRAGDFQYGAATRIAERLFEEAARISRAGGFAFDDNQKAIVKVLSDSGIELAVRAAPRRKVDLNSYRSGQKRGDAAAFARPVNGGAPVQQIGAE